MQDVEGSHRSQKVEMLPERHRRQMVCKMTEPLVGRRRSDKFLGMRFTLFVVVLPLGFGH